jgi:hypothetical protein
MPKSNALPLAATLATLFVSLCTGAQAAGKATAIDRSFAFSATSHFISTGSATTKTVKATKKSGKSVRRGKLAYMRLPANRGGDRLGRLAHGRTMNDDAWTGASWNGRTHRATNWSASAGLPEQTIPSSGEPAFGPGNSQPGLANIGADAPALLPPGRESNYKVSFNVPVGRNESVNLQAGIRKNALNIPGSSDPSLHAAWSMKF